MSIPKVVGVEQEYAIALGGNRDFDPVELSFLVVNAYEKATEAIWDYETESPLLDARGFRREGEDTVVPVLVDEPGRERRFLSSHDMERHRHLEVLRRGPEASEDRVGQMVPPSSLQIRREIDTDAAVTPRALQLLHRALGVEQRDVRHRVEPVRSMTAEVRDPAVIGSAVRQSQIAVAH